MEHLNNRGGCGVCILKGLKESAFITLKVKMPEYKAVIKYLVFRWFNIKINMANTEVN